MAEGIRMGYKMTSSELIFSYLLFAFCVLVVLLQFTTGLSLAKEVDAGLINGTLTANGILLAVLTASVISGRELLRQVHFALIKICFVFFVLAVAAITASMVQDVPRLSNYITLQISLVLTGLVSVIVIYKISKVMNEKTIPNK